MGHWWWWCLTGIADCRATTDGERSTASAWSCRRAAVLHPYHALVGSPELGWMLACPRWWPAWPAQNRQPPDQTMAQRKEQGCAVPSSARIGIHQGQERWGNRYLPGWSK